VPDLNREVQDLSLEVVDLKQEVPDLRSGGIPHPNLTPGLVQSRAVNWSVIRSVVAAHVRAAEGSLCTDGQRIARRSSVTDFTGHLSRRLFTADTRPDALRRLHHAAVTSPADVIARCDLYRTDGKLGAAMFSVPIVCLNERPTEDYLTVTVAAAVRPLSQSILGYFHTYPARCCAALVKTQETFLPAQQRAAARSNAQRSVGLYVNGPLGFTVISVAFRFLIALSELPGVILFCSVSSSFCSGLRFSDFNDFNDDNSSVLDLGH